MQAPSDLRYVRGFKFWQDYSCEETKPILAFFTIWDIWNVKLKLRTNDVRQKSYIHRFFTMPSLLRVMLWITEMISRSTDNRLKNLQLLTQQQNSKKYHHNLKHNKVSKRKLKATNLTTNKISFWFMEAPCYLLIVEVF